MDTVGRAREEERDGGKAQANGAGAAGEELAPQPPGVEGAASVPEADSSLSEVTDANPDSATLVTPEPEQTNPPLSPWTPALSEATLPARPVRATETATDDQTPVATRSSALSPGQAVRSASDLSPARVPWYWMALCFVLTFALYVAWIPHFILYSNPPTGDQVYYMLDTISLVQDGDLLLNNNYDNKDWEKFYDLAPRPPGYLGIGAPNPLPPMLANATARPPQEQYSFHLPGLAVWLIPAWLIGGAFSLWWPACIVFMGLLGALMALNVFLFAHELTGRAWIAWMVWAAVAFSGPLMSFSYLVFTELPVGLLLIYIFRRLALGWGANGPYRLVLMGLALGNIPWLAWRCVLIAGMLGLYALVQWWRWRSVVRDQGSGVGDLNAAQADKSAIRNPQSAIRNSWRSLALFFAPAIVLGALLLAYNIYLFGRLIPDSSVLEQGRVAIFHYPWQGTEDAQAFVSAIFGQLFDRGFGLLPYAPIYVLTFVGLIAAFRFGGAYKRLLLWMGLISVPYLLVICSFENWNGVWCPPARYLTTFVPFMAGLIAISLLAFRRSVVYKLLYVVLALPGFLFMWVMLDDARVMWPLTQGGVFVKIRDFQNSPIKIDLSQFLPIFTPVDDTTQVRNTGWMTLAVLSIVLLCYLLMQFQRRLREDAPRHMPYTRQGAMWGLTLLVVGSGWFFMNYDYIKHRTEFTELHRWTMPVPLDEPYGIAYYQGKVYVSSFARPTHGILGSFDPATEQFTPIEPISGTTPLLFAHIGDVQPGPDGNFYVLNNGDATDAMWVMKPDGTLVKGLDLQGKTPIATGFNFGPDGNIYVADMLGGHILKFSPGGGPATGVYGGLKGGFNNPAGVAVTPNGTIYASEMGFARLQKLASDGTFIRNINLHCTPMHLVVSGDFLDISCDRGLISVNWKTDEVQLAHYDAPDHRPDNPTGLTYGPDNTLYVLSGNTLIAYKVTH